LQEKTNYIQKTMPALKTLNKRYQLLSVLRKGGFGTIYKGYDSVLGKDIAVKEIKAELTDDAWYIDQFQNEARQVAKMNHQNIVHIFDLVKTPDGQFYIVMEFIDGLDMSKVLEECRKRDRPLPSHIAVNVIAEVCKALDYAHNCLNSETNEPLDLVHQDISPANIMIDRKGVVKLIDFGIASAQKKFSTDKKALMLQGKVQYMSPEQVTKDGTLDRRSDIFSLGLVLYEFIEGKRYFEDGDTKTIIDTLQNGKLKLKDVSRIPKPIQSVITKALEKAPEKRYQNANQLYIDLVTYLVLNSDSSSIDSELATFIRELLPAVTTPGSAPGDFDVQEPDTFISSIMKNLDEPKSPARGSKKETSPPGPKAGSPKQGAKPTDAPKIFGPPEPDLVKTEILDMLEPASVSPSRSATPPPRVENPDAYYEAGDEIKTVIDAVRLATRGHKHLFVRGGIGLGAALLLFFMLDITFQLTSMGTGIYDYLFPPTIKVASIPNGAKVHLDGKELPAVTPLSIDDISPGVHELKLVMAGFRPIIKSLHIPGTGEVQVTGEQSRRGSKPYTFRFKTTLELDSNPPGAEVYLSGIRYSQKTPCSVTWEVGEDCDIEMKLAGFNDLSGFRLRGPAMAEEIDDNRLWDLEVGEEPYRKYKVLGLFGRHVSIESYPGNAEIYHVGQNQIIGDTRSNNRIFLNAGTHQIILQKRGYNPRSITVSINEDTEPILRYTLTRPVRFRAVDAENSTPLDATLKQLVRNGRLIVRNRSTPIRLDLLPYEYTAIFGMEGYRDVTVEVPPAAGSVEARLERMKGTFSIVVLDSDAQQPVESVEIKLTPLDNRSRQNDVYQITDANGTCEGQIQPGLYMLHANKSGYVYSEKSVVIESTSTNLFEVLLSKL
jgi:serine/threonine-protein kinase